MKSYLLFSALIIPFILSMSGCDATDGKDKGLSGSYVFKADAFSDTIEFNFLGASKMQWSLDNKKPIDLTYTFSNGKLILQALDSLGRIEVFSAGQVAFAGEDFDYTFADVYYSDPDALPAGWKEAGLNSKLDSVFVTVYPKAVEDTVLFRQAGGGYAGKAGLLQATHWVDNHMLFVLTSKKWRFEKQ